MALNPITFTESVVGDFLRYQLTAYPFADERLYTQMRELLSLERTRHTPLLRGPYVSLSRAFRVGATLKELIGAALLHPLMESLVPYERLYGHQEIAIRAIASGRTTLISTGTGSGKTEAFLYPIISRCLRLRDEGAPSGIIAVLVYPMNALAEDQLGRLRDLLAGTGITFGMYVGKTPKRAADVPGERLKAGSSRSDYRKALERALQEKRATAVHPPEERPSREEMRAAGKQPRILLTNVKQLELLLTRQTDVILFDGARLDFLVMDEAHTYGGAVGAETACLIRRLRAFCGRKASETVCVGTSATLLDPALGHQAARQFASRFFGVAADAIEVVTEEYERDDWSGGRTLPPPIAGDPATQLRKVLAALGGPADEDNEAGARMVSVYREMSGEQIHETDWRGHLYTRLAANELCYRLAEALAGPKELEALAGALSEQIGRTVTEEEALIWLALGAASRRQGRPLLRSVIHAFIRGVGQAFVSFPASGQGPKLWLAGETAAGAAGELFRLQVTTCSTCGQHYFVHHVADLKVTPKGLGGGEAVGDRRVWRALDETQSGCRVVLLDHLVTGEAEGDDEVEDPARTQEVFLCRACGALHPQSLSRCDGCGRPGDLVRLLALEDRDGREGRLTACLSCKAPGRSLGSRYREPARPVRAVAVSDVHVIAQNMIHHAERRRLLVFADNRQDAAFQAGWMRDHARRFRLRALIAERIERGPVSVGDMTAHLDDLMETDEELSRALLPEVWGVARKEAAGVEHARQRKTYLRLQVLREVATGIKQRVGLEPWGRMQVEYIGLTSDLQFIREWAGRLDVDPVRLTEGISAVLDGQRRTMHLLDREGKVFSHFWMEGDLEVQRGYLPILKGVPKGLKLERTPGDDPNRITQWLSAKGDTAIRHAARAFGVARDPLEDFVRGLWVLLTEHVGLLAPVTLTGARGRALPGCAGARQIDADRILLTPHKGRYRCGRCRRTQVRPTPHDRCVAWRCDGALSFESESPDDYDLASLDQRLAMLRPAEHSAQVPPETRERLERQFKGEGDTVNTLVCTPTLEMGVDIGGLDTILLRNVPPLPANYWQRAGRAGRRHRLAVNVTYVRPTSHDRAYFAQPSKLLEGLIEPPRFNLKNEVMLDKHVRAALLTRLHQRARPGAGLGEFDRGEIEEALRRSLPPLVKDYLFDSVGHVWTEKFEAAALRSIVSKHAEDLVAYVGQVFRQGWPEAEAQAVEEERLKGVVLGAADDLERVVATLKKRLDWCLRQLDRLEEQRRLRGTLDPDEDALRARCDRLIKRLKGTLSRTRREAEGYDDTVTFGALAAEGYLPGYGLEVGAVVATALVPRAMEGGEDFELPRHPGVALREYVPGNLIYANGERFVPRFFHLEAGDPLLFNVDVVHQAVTEAGSACPDAVTALGSQALKAVPICDLDLSHASRITDEEEYRFQLPVAVYGHEAGRHGPGRRCNWGGRDLTFRRGVHLRLVNVGAATLVWERLGFPVSLVTGQSRSPFASRKDREEFSRYEQERYGRPVEEIGFYADIVADTLCLPSCPGREEAYSIVEALRFGMARELEMEREDLGVLVIGHPGIEQADALLYDPMPGGSGLLDQALERWREVVTAARETVEDCPAACERSCIDCLLTFRNAYYHTHLNRKMAAERLAAWGDTLALLNEIPARLPAAGPTGQALPVNDYESRLRGMLLRAGFPEGRWHHEIDLGRPLGTTAPDVFFDGEAGEPGVCVYLDGLSTHIHGNDRTAANDRSIREELRARRYEVFEIPAGALSDRDRMASYFFRLARILMGKDEARRLKEVPLWFEAE